MTKSPYDKELNWMVAIIVLCLAAASFISCSSLEGYTHYNPDYVRVEHRYNPSWGFYRHAYYRPVRYNWNWKPIVRQSYCPPPKRIVKSKTRRAHVSNQPKTKGRSKSTHQSSTNQSRGRRQ